MDRDPSSVRRVFSFVETPSFPVEFINAFSKPCAPLEPPPTHRVTEQFVSSKSN
jgi:hypothetical protein